jgi:hypothetical protein
MDPASWAAMTAAIGEMAAAATAGTAAAGTAAVAPEVFALAAPEMAMLAGSTAAPTAFAAMSPWGAMAPAAAEAVPWITGMAPEIGEAAIGFPQMLGGTEAFLAGTPAAMAGTAMPWGDMAMAGAKGLLSSSGEPQRAPSGGGRPGGGGAGAQQLPTFDYGAPTTQTVSMADLMRQREEMMRRRMQRGY